MADTVSSFLQKLSCFLFAVLVATCYTLPSPLAIRQTCVRVVKRHHFGAKISSPSLVSRSLWYLRQCQFSIGGKEEHICEVDGAVCSVVTLVVSEA